MYDVLCGTPARTISAVILGLVVSLGAAAQVAKPAPKSASSTIPNSWLAFESSADPADKKAVARIRKMKWYDICVAWGREARAKKPDERFRMAALYHLQAESSINGKDLGNVTSQRPEVGMTFCGVLAQQGMPEKVNQTENARGHSAQMVYRSRGMYVYTEGKDANGLVRSIQF